MPPDFVGDDADDLVRRLGVDQRAGVDEHAPPVGDERVEAAVAQDDDLDRAPAEAGGCKDWRRIIAQQVLDLGVANQG